MMPIALTAFRKRAMVGFVMPGVEHSARGILSSDAFSPKVIQMRAQRCALNRVPYHARLDDHTA
jgi:hypothetical protein